MKKILGISILLIVLVLGGYFSTGLITQRTVKQNLKALNQANGLSIDLVNYQRGLFSSTADLTWHLQKPEKIVKQENGRSLIIPPKVYTFDMPIVIHHGPIIFGNGQIRFGLGAAHGELPLPEAYVSEFTDMFSSQSTKPKLNVNLFVTYLNKTHLEIGLPAFQLVTKNNQNRFEWLGMESDLRFSPESTHLQGNFTLNGLRLIGKKFQVILNKVTSAYDVHRSKTGLFLGTANLDLPELQVTADQKPEFGLKRFELHSKSDLKDNLFDSSFSATFSTLTSRDKTYGPGELDIAIKRLDANVLAALNQHINQLQRTDTLGGQAQQILLSLLPDLPKLLSKGARFEIGVLKFGLPEGAIDGAMHLVFPELETDAPMQILSKIEGDARLRVPAIFLKAALTHSFRQKLINDHDQTLSAHLDADDKKPLSSTPLSADSKKTAEQNTAEKPLTLADLDQQAVQQADQKLKKLVEMGVLKTKEADYVIELKLSSGRLLVNDQPFHSEMLSF